MQILIDISEIQAALAEYLFAELGVTKPISEITLCGVESIAIVSFGDDTQLNLPLGDPASETDPPSEDDEPAVDTEKFFTKN
jgi:hypothetical protein